MAKMGVFEIKDGFATISYEYTGKDDIHPTGLCPDCWALKKGCSGLPQTREPPWTGLIDLASDSKLVDFFRRGGKVPCGMESNEVIMRVAGTNKG
jgi:hypothetical protein